MANVGSKKRVVILFGGRSAEHEVSLLSARNVAQALDRERFEPLLVGIDKQGRWHLESQATLDAAVGDPRGVRLDPNAPVVDASVLRPGDVVFPALHGTFGEDGTMQGLLELAGVAYVGAPVLGSAVGMDKDVTKRLLRDAGLPIVPYRMVTARAFREDAAACLRAGEELGFPLFCKPANAGSSVGVSRVLRAEELGAALTLALQFDTKVLLEQGIDAREVECAVLGNEQPEASIPGEIVLSHRDGFYSYDAKYVDPTGALFRVPADIPTAVSKRVRELSVATFRALELAGLARVDFFLDRRDGTLYVNEVNTLPGFTEASGYPKMWAASGLAVRPLVSRLIDLALERQAAAPARKGG
ncbi:MAG TPA: D-alanine--D-alanine ligase family protein [Polyangia bacterium]|jgi:D-alanine-D-alanine ligase